ncbi:Bug family tripartite tricarboxylate transporter substrate binding protein [Acidovorax soli]|uniref:Bug family tripartite tricarboxylate transporter substrate binding protein n=1 Tax=Acidovorax TaxID=12916 RepID=UPI0026F013F1|nr:tripartite tricarboxylate transporter substrate binding protein [Acidovorax soli]MCM2345061.1 tripartite tricarboxylate transporter substrate binding protein [Acidovorax soli]
MKQPFPNSGTAPHGRRRAVLQTLASVTCMAALGATALVPAVAHSATDYPKGPIRLVVPYPPGGPTDLVGRVVAAAMGDILKQSFFVDNKPGASGMVGGTMVAKAPADGYTLLSNASLHVINPSVYEKVPYDAFNDFAPITQIVDVPLVLVVRSDLPVSSVQELIAYLKQNKGAVNFASAGNASSQHLSGELFKIRTGIAMQHVPYKGSSPALTDLMGGQVQLMFDSMPSAMPFITSGKLKALAVTTRKRSRSLPQIPTMQEAGVAGFETSTWYGLWAPRNTPADVVGILARAAQEALRKPEIAAQYQRMGAEPVGSSPQEFEAYMKSEEKKWTEIVRLSGAKAD